MNSLTLVCCVSNMCLSICLSVGGGDSGVSLFMFVCDDDAKCMWTNFGGVVLEILLLFVCLQKMAKFPFRILKF